MPSPRPVRTWQELLGPLLGGEQDVALDVVADALRSGLSRCVVYETLVVPCLREIGLLWEHGEASVPDEHLATETMLRVLNHQRCSPTVAPDAPTAVVACAPLEGHTLPALLASDLLTDAGWRVWHVGGSAPPRELAAFVRRREPQLLVLTTTLTRTADGVAAVSRALEGSRRPAILAGGAGVRHLTTPAAIGADGLGHRLADLLTFAGLVSTGAVTPTGAPARPLSPSAARAGLAPHQVELVLLEAATPLSISEIRERCGSTASQVGSVLNRLERAHRVRFTGGRWAATGARSAVTATPGPPDLSGTSASA